MLRRLLPTLALLLVGCNPSRPTLNILSFPDYFDPQVIAGFEKAFHCQVKFDYMDSGDAAVAKLAAGGASVYDLLGGIGDSTTFSKQGLLSPLRLENIPNLKNIDPQFDLLSFDGPVRYSAPYLWGTTGLYVRKPTNGPLEESWGLLFDPAQQRGSFFLVNEHRTCIGAALRYKGYSVNSTDPKELAEARDLVIEAKRRSLGFLDGTAVRNRIQTKGADMAMAWNEIIGESEDPETHYFMPREGCPMILDGLGIPAKAPHRDLAEKFINYLLDPRIGAQTATFLRAATPNQAALEFINPADRKNPAIYPPPELRARIEVVRDLGSQNRLYDEIWTQIKAK